MRGECDQLGDQLSAYLDGELDSEGATQVESHLESCVQCRGMLDGFRSLDAIAVGASVPEVKGEEWQARWAPVSEAVRQLEPSAPPDRCAEIEELMDAYLDGQLGSEGTAEVDEHLASCEGCRGLVGQFRAMDAAAQAEPVPPVSDDEWGQRWRDISAAVSAPGTRPVRRSVWISRVLWLTAAAAGLFLVLWVAHLMAPEEPPTPPLAWKTSHEFSLEAVDASGADVMPICYYSEEADLTIIWLATD